MLASEVAMYFNTFLNDEQVIYQSSACHGTNVQALSVCSTPSPLASFGPSTPEHEVTNMEAPYLRVVEQPVSKFRFRYRSEMQGAHGSLLGCRETSKKKSYPAVELVNFEGEARIRCSLYTAVPPLIPHMHQLIGKQNGKEILDHEVIVSERNGHRAEFKGLGIVHMSKKDLKNELLRKKENHVMELLRKDEQLAQMQMDDETLRGALREQLEREATKESETMDPNKVKLCFEAFIRGPDGQVEQICQPVFSETIQNMKSAETGELKICRMDKCAGSCNGGDEIYILVEKVCKKNIQVRFFEVDQNEEEVWSDFGQFSEFDVHHQYAIVFRTPPYHKLDITRNVPVRVQLVRPKDQAKSASLNFSYKPARRYAQRSTSLYSSSSLSSLESSKEVVEELMRSNNDDPMLSGSETSSFNSLRFPSDAINQALNDIARANEEAIVHEFENFVFSTGFQEYSDLLPGMKVREPAQAAEIVSPSQIFPEMDHETIVDQFVPENNMSSYGGNILQVVMDGAREMKQPAMKEPKLESERQKVETSNLARKAYLKLLKLMKSRHPSRLQDMKHIIKAQDQEFGPLHAAVLHGQLKELSDLLSLIIKSNLLKLINSSNHRKMTPLMVAVEVNNMDCLKLLCMAKADLNCADLKGNTALHKAVKCRRAKCLEVLLSFKRLKDTSGKIELDRKNDKGQTALHIAAMQNDLQSAKLLIDAGADINAKTGTAGHTPLHLAVEFGWKEMVAFLLRQEKINVQEKNFNEKRALDIVKPIQKEITSLFEQFKEDDDEEEGEKNMSERVEDEEEDDDEMEEEDDGDSKDEDETVDDVAEAPKAANQTSGDFRLLDQSTFELISHHLDDGEKWKIVCQKMKCNFLISVCGKNTSPARCLLSYLEVDKSLTLSGLRDILEELNVPQAVKALNKIIMQE